MAYETVELASVGRQFDGPTVREVLAECRGTPLAEQPDSLAALEAYRDLRRQRDALILQARQEGHKWGQISIASGLDCRYVQQIGRDRQKPVTS
jgi:hypothetical protein